MSDIYVVCPANSISGGPDALHQLVYYLNNIGCKASIVYYSRRKEKIEIQQPYKVYINSYISFDNLVVDKDDIIIFPETNIFLKKKVKCKKVVWWLSVDNNAKYTLFNRLFILLTIPLRFIKNNCIKKRNLDYIKYIKFVLSNKKYNFNNEKNFLYHMCASYYALDYVSKRTSNKVYTVIEPISKFFLKEYERYEFNRNEKENIILYNPAKCNNIIKKLIRKDKKHIYIPLKGMTQEELMKIYKKAKIFIDLGPFPGAERMPKEAVLFNCCIITGRRGASNYYNDVPIPDKYKFKNIKEYNKIIKLIDDILKEYDTVINDFIEYKKMVLSLEKNFVESLKNVILSKNG